MIMDQDWAILHGSFLLADKLCLPSSLSSLQKCDWQKVGNPVLAAVGEICGEGNHLKSKAASWRKKLVCVVWLKLLSKEHGEDMEEAWRESPFFPLQNPLPEVNYTVLVELLKSLSAADTFAHFLLCLPRHQLCSELDQFSEHMKSNPVGEDDVHFFLELWWQLWKSREDQLAERQDGIEVLFARRVAHLTTQPASLTHHTAKRMKLDSTASPNNTDVLDILLHLLTDVKDAISKPEHCSHALSNCLDSLYTTFLTDQSVILPIKDKLLFLSKAMSIREKNNDKLTSELLQEAQRDLRASYTPSKFQPSRLSLFEALKSASELTQSWQNHDLLKACCSSPASYAAFKLQQSVHRMLAALEEADMTGEEEVEKNKLRGLLASLTFPIIETSSEVSMRVAMTIISHRLEDYHDVTVLFASETSWLACDEQQWLECLEKNQTAFQQCNTVIQLASTLSSLLQSENFDVSWSKRLLKVVTAVFTALSLEDKNKALAAILKSSSKGFFGTSGGSALIASFERELNMAFNCIIQGGGGASTAEGNLSTAVSLVARMAFQNPEATLRSCCHSAIFNKGAFSLVSKILKQLPGLGGLTQCKEESEGRNPTHLLCRCLQEVASARSLSENEKEQFHKFVALLMVATGEGEKETLLSPQELVNVFVLPNLACSGNGSVDLKLSLQLLHAALCVDTQEVASSSAHWVLECSPFPLLFILAQLQDQALRCWEQPLGSAVHRWSMETSELLTSVLITLAQVVGAQVEATPSRWSRALFWLHDKMKGLDWTVYFYLKPVWGVHFKNEVPSSLLAVCDLPEQEWSALNLPQYGHGTGLLAWMECCALSDSLQSTMLSCLDLDQRRSEHVSMFSKGLLVALTQTMPWCSVPQWSRLLGTLKELITSGRLHVPFSLEYVEFLPLLDLRQFSYELCLSVLMLRVLQLLCGSSCSHWLSGDGWAHVARLYAHTMREVMNSLKAKLALPASGALTGSTQVHAAQLKVSEVSCTPVKTPKMPQDCLEDLSESAQILEQVPSQEVLFVLSQIFCHVQHIQVMMPGGQSEPLFLSSLEILSHYQAIAGAFPESSSPLENENIKHFFNTITDNLENQEMKSVLQQKIAQLA
ncbi:gem-associated protein 4 isoform X1 [Syngnathus acus]|uniref:gem-associated protein 4 isoform X1 n=2 Tax=Syngnathus acus TaxID=161584 RepID=UPI001885C4ED|nr:gem-associated protein 4 isoform X1 [Syngnathus acus]XP_037124632.1 gem-associated protein 4 isoform X1 [Syngnathus acus]